MLLEKNACGNGEQSPVGEVCEKQNGEGSSSSLTTSEAGEGHRTMWQMAQNTFGGGIEQVLNT